MLVYFDCEKIKKEDKIWEKDYEKRVFKTRYLLKSRRREYQRLYGILKAPQTHERKRWKSY